MADSFHSKPISTLHLAWAAGFMEGEGSFVTQSNSPKVSAAQVQREPLDRLRAMFGGTITSRYTNGFSDKQIWVWSIKARRSAEVMMTLYVLMSPRRQDQIANSLSKWKNARTLKPHFSDICIRGHKLTSDNVYRANGYTRCKTCQLAAKKRYREKAASNDQKQLLPRD